MAERLVDTRFLFPPIQESVSRISIDRKYIDGYNHVNHAAYMRIFNLAKPVPDGKRVSALSLSYSDQFREKDLADITTAEYPYGPQGLEIIEQTMKKPGAYRSVKQATRLINLGSEDILPVNLAFEPENQPIITDSSSSLVLPGNGETFSHMDFAPIFEEERAKLVEEKGSSVEELRDMHNLLTVIMRLESSFRGFFRGGETAHFTNQAHLDNKLRAGYMSLVFFQTLTGQEGQEVKQLTHYLFVDGQGNLKPLPQELETLLTS